MPIKDSLRIFKCKYCNKEFSLFERANGELIFYSDNTPWPIHGKFVLQDHLKTCHRNQYENLKIFYPINEMMGKTYEITK